MAIEILARDWTIEVYDGTDYITIGGINSFTLSTSKDNAETTTFDSAGWGEHIPAERTKSVSLEGYYLEDDTGTRDAGQTEIETLAEEMGQAGIETVHLASPNGGFEVWLDGSFDTSDIGGGNNDPTSWGFEFELTGAPSDTDPNV